MVVATPNRWSAGVLRRKLADRLRGQRRPPAAYYAAESHLREYTWRDLTRMLSPHVAICRRAGVGWSGSPLRRLASAVLAAPVLRTFSRMLVVEVEPRS
jgi:hypothetical protein